MLSRSHVARRDSGSPAEASKAWHPAGRWVANEGVELGGGRGLREEARLALASAAEQHQRFMRPRGKTRGAQSLLDIANPFLHCRQISVAAYLILDLTLQPPLSVFDCLAHRIEYRKRRAASWNGEHK